MARLWGNHQRRADPLQETRAHEGQNTGGESAHDRRAGKTQDAGQKEEFAAVTVSRRAADQNDTTERKRIAIDHPLHRLEWCRKLAFDRGKSDRDNGSINKAHGGRKDRRRQNEGALSGTKAGGSTSSCQCDAPVSGQSGLSMIMRAPCLTTCARRAVQAGRCLSFQRCTVPITRDEARS